MCREKIRAEGAIVVEDQVLPAYRRLRQFITHVSLYLLSLVLIFPKFHSLPVYYYFSVVPMSYPFDDGVSHRGKKGNKSKWGHGVILTQDAFNCHIIFLTLQEYIPHSRPGLGLSSVAGGLEYYQARLRWHLGVGVVPAPEKLYRLGVLTVEGILEEMNRIKQMAEYQGTLVNFLKHVQGANKFFYRNEASFRKWSK